jgi:hypothetical protein
LTKHNQGDRKSAQERKNERGKEGIEGENERWNGKYTEGVKKDKVTRTEKKKNKEILW